MLNITNIQVISTGSTIRCHPSFDEKEIALQVGQVFPPVIICSKDVFWTYVRVPRLFFEI